MIALDWLLLIWCRDKAYTCRFFSHEVAAQAEKFFFESSVGLARTLIVYDPCGDDQ